MEELKQVLKEYDIGPAEIVQMTNRLYKVHTYNYTFALKRSRLNPHQAVNWRNAYQQAYRHELKAVVPVYMTSRGELFVQHQGSYYYLTPWQETMERDEPVHGIEAFFREISSIHKQTIQENDILFADVQEIVAGQSQQVRANRRKLLEYVERFEARRFMSPFELQVCTHYRDIERAFTQLESWLDYYLEDIQADNRQRKCLCHGNLRSSHILTIKDNGYLVNWEHSFTGNPVHDLVIYFNNEFQYHDSLFSEVMNFFPLYEKRNPLLLSEKSLLAILLLNPSSYLELVEKNLQQQSDKALPFQVRDLERAHRRLIHGLKLQGILYEQREKILEEQLQED
ncbi:phosphotransferase [Sediminibacillus albus]|uniref:Spore coat protein YsxE n=1 Tax=Sediminibacillus albus TaxID=407036 RepID=A0A1G9BP47_9BACI|nr:phosphotransferase [Sediminibacillus albus]SDK41268.1 spore coat protein YsxE [Sediminibacillus albus]